MIRLFSACVLLCAFFIVPAEAKQRRQSACVETGTVMVPISAQCERSSGGAGHQRHRERAGAILSQVGQSGLRLVSFTSRPRLAGSRLPTSRDQLPGAGVINRRGLVVLAVFTIALVGVSLSQFGL
jgi:hypothetical protein